MSDTPQSPSELSASLISELDKKLPELKDFRILFHKEEAVDLPYFIRLITCASMKHDGPNIAFIVPQPEMVAYFVSMFAALLDTKTHFAEWRENFARHGLREHQNVQVLPTGEIYEYAGVTEYTVNNGAEKITSIRFVLKLLGVKGGGGSTSLPISEVLRLVPTDRAQPYGTGKTPASKMVLSDLDNVLGIESFGNLSVFKNRIVLHSTRQQMEDFFSNWDIHSHSRKSTLEDMTDFPWGIINSEGDLLASDKYQAYGEPIIALANRLSPIDAYCSKQSENTRTVILCNLNAALKNSYDIGAIAERQRVMLITDHLDEKEAEEIRNHNIEIWKLRKEEVFLGLHERSVFTDMGRVAPLKKLFVGAGAGADMISVQVAESPLFLRVCDNIASLQRGIEDKDTRDAVVSRFQRVLWRASELVQLPGKEYQDWLIAQVIEIENSLKNHSSFLRKDLLNLATETAAALMNELLPDIKDHASNKFGMINDIIVNAMPAKTLVLARHGEAANAMANSLQSENYDATVMTYDDIGSLCRNNETGFEEIIIAGWPGRHLFLEILHSGIADKIHAVFYEHEKECVDRFFREFKRTDGKLNPSAEKKEEITGLPASAFRFADASENVHKTTEQNEVGANREELQIRGTADIFDVSWSVRPPADCVAAIDASHAVKAKFVSLSNDMCLYLSEDQHVSVISTTSHEYKRKTVEEIVLGDIIVFRGGSEKEILREVAISIYGDSYDKLWSIAITWKSWLRSLGSDTGEIWKKLMDAGLNRHPVTIFQWLSYEDRIGPQNLNDIVVIAKATGDESKVKDTARVADAIKRIRGVHVEAGFKLTEVVMRQLAQRASPDADNNGDLARKLSDVKLYTVEDIDDEYQNISPQFANIPRSVWSFDLDRMIDEILTGKEMAHG